MCKTFSCHVLVLTNMALRESLESVLKALDEHDDILNKGFKEIQTLIKKQRENFDALSEEFNTYTRLFELKKIDIMNIEETKHQEEDIKPEDDEQFDDIKQTDSENEFNENENENDQITHLLNVSLPEEVKEVLGEPMTWTRHTSTSNIDKNLMKCTESFTYDNEEERKYAKLSILKYYDLLYQTFVTYCKIGGDKDWLTQKGWETLCKDLGIVDKKSRDVYTLLEEIYHGNAHRMQKSPWNGIWQKNTKVIERYHIKQIGDNKLIGFIKGIECISGCINSDASSTWILRWHEGARKGKRRTAECRFTTDHELYVKWKSIDDDERGHYTLSKYSELATDDDVLFEDKMGLALHQYLTAVLRLARIRYPQHKPYHSLCILCESHFKSYVCAGLDDDMRELKPVFKPYATELHNIFNTYNSMDTTHNAMGKDEWNVLCMEILRKGETSFKNGGKPTNLDYDASFELAKQEYDEQLNYQGFEHALTHLARRMFKPKPNQKYKNMPHRDKLTLLLKWTGKVQKQN
eukprot:1021756_1